MTQIADWLDLMPDTVVVQSFAGRDQYGVGSYGSPNGFEARVTYRNRSVTTASGEEVVARGEAWLATVEHITPQDKITLSDGTNPLILSVDRISDETGPLYTKIFFL